MMNVHGVQERIESLTARERDRMFALMQANYDGVLRETFERDLSEKDSVLVLRDRGGLRGFSTLKYFHREVDGQTVRVMYSGDTIVDKRCWGSPEVPKAIVRAQLDYLPHCEGDPLYWMLTTKGEKTYRFLPVLYRRFYPCVREETPYAIRRLIDCLATEKYGDAYDAERGVVVHPHGQRLKCDTAPVDGTRRKNPHVAYFLHRNPDYLRGDELVCVARVTWENLRSGIRRWMAREVTV